MMIGSTGRVAGKPFKNSHDEQIKLVTSFDWLNLNALAGIDEELQKLVEDFLFIPTGNEPKPGSLGLGVAKRQWRLSSKDRNDVDLPRGSNTQPFTVFQV